MLLSEANGLLYLTLMFGAASTVFFHNTVVSISTARKRAKPNKIELRIKGLPRCRYRSMYITSPPLFDFARIIFNITGGLRFIFQFIYFVLPPFVDPSTCKAVSYVHATVNLLYRGSLPAFLLLRLRIIGERQTIITKPSPSNLRPVYCDPNLITGSLVWGWVIADFLIDIFVTIQMVRIFHEANKNYKDLSTQSVRGSLYLAIIFWHLIRIFIAILLNLNTVIDAAPNNLDPIISPTVNFVICIAMSYVITYDKDIVKNITVGLDAKASNDIDENSETLV
nr:867_t:CDS:2 [Entrophospora candida]